MIDQAIEGLADILFAMTGATRAAAGHPGRWWRQRFFEALVIVGGFCTAMWLLR